MRIVNGHGKSRDTRKRNEACRSSRTQRAVADRASAAERAETQSRTEDRGPDYAVHRQHALRLPARGALRQLDLDQSAASALAEVRSDIRCAGNGRVSRSNFSDDFCADDSESNERAAGKTRRAGFTSQFAGGTRSHSADPYGTRNRREAAN